jgi:hypothetical protein
MTAGSNPAAIERRSGRERWLRYWLTTRRSIRPSTQRSYAEHMDNHLVPHLGLSG